LLAHERELRLEREVGEVAGDHEAVDLDLARVLDDAIEEVVAVVALAAEQQVHAAGEALVEPVAQLRALEGRAGECRSNG
jgi:hypothetical protein